MAEQNPTGDHKIETFFINPGPWQPEFQKLRGILLDCQLTEAFKWGWPCYLYETANVVILHGFKDYCALLFIKGALLQDPEGLLIRQTENVQAGRQLRFTSLAEIVRLEPTIKAYVREALAIEKAGLEVPNRDSKTYPLPAEFQKKLEDVPGLRSAFVALSPGRQHGYLLHFSQAKQAKTREARIEASIPGILAGRGLGE